MGAEQQFNPDHAVLLEMASWIERWSIDRFDPLICHELNARADQFARASEEIVLVEQAAGVLAWRRKVSQSGAMTLLLAVAEFHGRPVAQVAAGSSTPRR